MSVEEIIRIIIFMRHVNHQTHHFRNLQVYFFIVFAVSDISAKQQKKEKVSLLYDERNDETKRKKKRFS